MDYLIHHSRLTYTTGTDETARRAVQEARHGSQAVGIFSPYWPGSITVYALDKPATIARRIRALDAKHAPRGPGGPDGGEPVPWKIAA